MLSYTYDEQNQLTTVKNGSGTTLYSYSYDTMGNIRSKTDGSVTHLYTYGNPQWADLLTAYDGHTITYDGSGNPLSYYNGADYTFTWEQGRQLASVTKGNKTASYTYDMSGVRSGKVVNGVSYEYTTLSGKITRMTWSGNAVDIVYDDAGRPYLLRYTPSGGATQTYYYVLNLQGDVVGLMNSSMQMVVKYSYDPWGKLTGTTATSAYVALAQANPLRYRSYCYDIETGFYYLQSRYYDPTIARFINADSYLSTDVEGLLSANMFAYCENNPVNMSDETGAWPSWATKLVAAVAVVAVVAAVAAVTVATAGAGTAAAVIAVGAAKGAAIGMVSGAAVGAATGAVSHRASTGSWSGAGTAALNGMGDGALSGAVTGAITGAAGSAVKVSQAAKAWDSGTFKSGYQSMKYHYNKHVVGEGLTNGNNVLKYTQDAVSFANRNSSVLKYTHNYNYGNASWNLTYSTGQGGMFTQAGKILTFWYK